MQPSPFLALADVHHVTCHVGGRALDVFVFDHHRTAFTVWSLAAQREGPLTLLTLDRHMDLGVPAKVALPYTSDARALDGFARHDLAPSNDDHIVAAMEAGAIDHAAVVARSHWPPDLGAFRPYRGRTGRLHECAFSPSLERASPELVDRVLASDRLVLDIDLDCFTTRSDGHVDEVITWDESLIDAFLRPDRFDWAPVLDRVRVVTIAREPYHCGGLGRGAALWHSFARVFFERLLGVPAP